MIDTSPEPTPQADLQAELETVTFVKEFADAVASNDFENASAYLVEGELERLRNMLAYFEALDGRLNISTCGRNTPTPEATDVRCLTVLAGSHHQEQPVSAHIFRVEQGRIQNLVEIDTTTDQDLGQVRRLSRSFRAQSGLHD